MLFRWILIVAVAAVFPAHAKTPSILVSIAPLHSVVAAVADGVFAPDLLMQPSQSVHEYRLKPSDLRKISSADAVFYGGRTLEGFLPKAIENAGVRGVSFLSDAMIRISGCRRRRWRAPPKKQPKNWRGLTKNMPMFIGRMPKALPARQPI